jgi:hypothetical protein
MHFFSSLSRQYLDFVASSATAWLLAFFCIWLQATSSSASATVGAGASASASGYAFFFLIYFLKNSETYARIGDFWKMLYPYRPRY